MSKNDQYAVYKKLTSNIKYWYVRGGKRYTMITLIKRGLE